MRALAGSILLLSMIAAAQAQPKFQFEKPPEKPSDWQVQAKGGLLITTGNSQSRNTNFALTASHQTGYNKVSLEAGLASGRSNVLVPVIDPATMTVTALDRQQETTTNQWKTRGRYDRFLTDNNSAYVLGQI